MATSNPFSGEGTEIIVATSQSKLRVKFDPAEDNLFGDIQRIIYLRSNDPATPEAEAEFRVIIQKPEG